ncbi:hypothetical protein PoB_004797800 [Plakobranchus ocellatus]|uniref:Uncharacterized protein n=1 Tax=Plakobranchus ocellatus TaxID=259542 RepID=A0AAV4BPG5_9GAST|nr:hypothetical protein PoB_004797800 [Plakobranchus ocellatus]
MTTPGSAAPSRCFSIMTRRHSVLPSAHIHSCISTLLLVRISESCFRLATGCRSRSHHSPCPRLRSRKTFLVVLDDPIALPKWLGDSDNATCNSKPNATLLHLKMFSPNQDFWIRLETKEINIREVCCATYLLALSEITEESELQFGTGSKTDALQSCDRLEVSEVVAGRSFNIYCTFGNGMRDIYIRGRVVSQLCSVYVSEGRAVPFTLSAEEPTRSVEVIEKGYGKKRHTFNCTSVQGTPDREARATVNFAYPVSLLWLRIHAPRKDAQKSGWCLTCSLCDKLNVVRPAQLSRLPGFSENQETYSDCFHSGDLVSIKTIWDSLKPFIIAKLGPDFLNFSIHNL